MVKTDLLMIIKIFAATEKLYKS